MNKKPEMSVFHAYSFPSRRTNVFTLPMSRAAESITSHSGITSRL